MKQMHIDEGMVVAVDYENPSLHPAIQELRPQVFQDGDAFCCLLGPDPTAGVFGCGDTADEAETDWVRALQQRLAESAAEDTVATEIRDMLQQSKRNVW